MASLLSVCSFYVVHDPGKMFFLEWTRKVTTSEADQRQVVCNQLTRRALGTGCSFSTPSVCWTPPHHKSSKIQSEWAVCFVFFSLMQGWTRHYHKNVELLSLHPLPLGITVAGPQGHGMSATDRVSGTGDPGTGVKIWNVLFCSSLFYKEVCCKLVLLYMGNIYCTNRETPSKHVGWSYKAKLHLELDLAVKSCKKAFHRHISKKGKSRENMVPLRNGGGDRVTRAWKRPR